MLTAGAAALTAAIATAATWPGQSSAALSAARQGGSCDAVAGAYQFPGADGVTPAAWTGDGLTVPACGPIPNDGGSTAPIAPYPGALKTPGYQCVEFSERYLYYRYGVTMGISTNGDQVAAHYAAKYPAKFMIVKSGTPNRAPVAGDVLSMAKVPGFDGADGGHTGVVQSSSVNASGNGTVTIVEENAVSSGVQVLRDANWNVTYDGFPYLVWLTTAGMIVTTPTLPPAQVSEPYSTRLTAAGGKGADRWAVTAGALPPGLSLSAAGVLSGTISAATASGGDLVRSWPFTVTATDSKGAAAVAGLKLTINGWPDAFYYDSSTRSLRDAQWTSAGWALSTLDGSSSKLAGHTDGDVGRASSAVEIDGGPIVFYSDSATGSLRAAWRAGGATGNWRFETLDGPGSTLAGHTAGHVGTAISASVVAGEPEVFYYDASSASVRWARLTAAGWQFETLDGPGSALYQHTWHHVGSAISAVVVDGAPQVYYYDATSGALHRAWWSRGRWFFLTIDGPTSQIAGHTGFRVGSAISATLLGGQPQVYYDDDGASSLRHARQTAAGWKFETLDGPSSTLPGRTADHVGSAVSVTQMNGDAQVYYYDATRESLRHAWWTGSAWQFETLDGPGSVVARHDGDRVGSAVSVTEITNGPQVYDADGTAHSLRHAWWTSAGWQFETLDGPGAKVSGRTGNEVGAAMSVTDY
ncbi:MAG TPA: putative Ig domain-containing protein [Trebonia sp.]|nr:putative Ig domain-containing protein [Trebonia sp.]